MECQWGRFFLAPGCQWGRFFLAPESSRKARQGEMKYRAVIFDFNGTMFADSVFQFQSWNRVLEAHGKPPITMELYRRELAGVSSRKTVEQLWGADLPASRVEMLRAEKKTAYQEICLADPAHFCLVKGLPAYLDRLKEEGVLFTIASSSNPTNMDFYFAHLGLDRWFDRENVICFDGKRPGKPAPDLYLAAMSQLQVKPEECLIYEDGIMGILSANRAGAGCVRVINPEHLFEPGDGISYEGVYEDFLYI